MAAKEEFELRVINEKGVLYYGSCSLLFLPSARGEIAVMKHHTPMIMMLAKGTVRMQSGGGKTQDITEVDSGVVYVAEDTVSVLVNL